MKRSFGLVLLVVFFALSLGGCASMQEWCGPHKAAVVETPPPVKVVQKAPEPVKTVQPAPPPIKKDRN
jgi:hypothetical protein